MSASYHALQNRGCLFSTHEALSRQWRDEFTLYDPDRISSILNLQKDEDCLYVSYFETLYRLRLLDGVLEKEDNNNWRDDLYFNESMSIYHLLHYTKDHPRISGVWVPAHALAGPGINAGGQRDPLLESFAGKFAGKLPQLEKACSTCGGTPLTAKGDLSFQFSAFPQISLQLIFYDADEDFPAQAQVLLDQCVTDYIHFETTGCLICDLFDRLEEAAKNLL